MSVNRTGANMTDRDLTFTHACVAPPTFFRGPKGIMTPSNPPGMWIHTGGKTGVYIPDVIAVQFDSAGHVVQFETATRIYKKVTQ